ncbi:hypothetical protein DSO57_1034868 [Entomophthora muscae]|uniref:Uncharacterized protein n=1 Tax=Entomophthora muscae TaxID=34485 RepID=A0ACC2U9A8_9FUNG|nr:hypothetical protein DSO57_1034868 [Entomophthora muscae]
MIFEDFLKLSPHQIDNFNPLEAQVQERVSTPDLEYSQAASPKDQGAGCLCFIGIKSLQAEAGNNFQYEDPSESLEITPPVERLDKLPNGGKEIPNIRLMSLKSNMIITQDSPSDGTADLKAPSMTMTQEQKDQSILPGKPSNKQQPGNSAILLLQTPGVLVTQPHIS